MDLSIATAIKEATDGLTAAGCNTPRLDAELLLAHALDQNRTWLYAHLREALVSAVQPSFLSLIERRAAREPVAYITGHKSFFGLDFHVTPKVLIPRPETEHLIEAALPLTTQPATIADICTGSGCIAVTLAHHRPQATILAVDISEAALSVARCNAARHGVSDRITFLHGHLLDPLPHPVDLIISNPPYVSQPDLDGGNVMPEVSQHEPRLALDGGPDGLDLIRQLLAQSQQALKPGGSLLIEIGADQGGRLKALAEASFPKATVSIKQDLAEQDRILSLIFP